MGKNHAKPTKDLIINSNQEMVKNHTSLEVDRARELLVECKNQEKDKIKAGYKWIKKDKIKILCSPRNLDKYLNEGFVFSKLNKK